VTRAWRRAHAALPGLSPRGDPARLRLLREYVRAVDLLLDCGAFPDPTYLWWDVRPQPKLGTVELRIMDAQSTLGATAALVALVQSLGCGGQLELLGDLLDHPGPARQRKLAARDGLEGLVGDLAIDFRGPLTRVERGVA
jgi:carboxylate-amine ligase